MCDHSTFKVFVEIPMDGPRGVCLTPVPEVDEGRLVVPLNFPGGFVVVGENMATILKDDQQVNLGPVTAVSGAGNPAPLDGPPQWQSSDENIIAVEVMSEDGLHAIARATGQLGNAQVSVVGDADMGEGVRELTGVLDFEVKAGDAVALSIPVGPAETIPKA